MVTRVSEDLAEFSIVIEKMSSGNSACARGSNPTSTAVGERVTLQLKGNVLKAAQKAGGRLQLWSSDLTSGNGEGVNPPDDQVFQRQSPLTLSSDGTIELTVHPNEIHTITTLTSGKKGNHSVPAATPFPTPFTQAFDEENLHAPPKYWYTQMGAWEVRNDPYNTKHGKVMRQMSPVWPACWGYSCNGPTAFFGPKKGGIQGPHKVSLSVRLEEACEISFGVGGTTLALDTKGTFAFGGKSGKAAFTTDQWHSVEIEFAAGYRAVSLDHKVLTNVTGGESGNLSLLLKMSRYVFASLDDFSITPLV